MLARRGQIINKRSDDSQVPWLQSRGIQLVRGEARLDGARRVRVGDDVPVAWDAVVIAVGSGR